MSARSAGATRNDRVPRSFERLESRDLLTVAPTVVDVHLSSSAWTPAFGSYLTAQGHGDLGFRVPVGSTAQTKSLPWSNLDKISISFSEHVVIDVADLSLSGINATSFPVAEFHYFSDSSHDRHVATWRLANPLPKNAYQIDLDANGLNPIADESGNLLDGEWANNSDTMPSGNGTAGGDFQFTFRVLPGDVNQNSSVEYADYYAASTRIGATTGSSNYLALADIDGSGVIQTQDAQAIQSKLWSTYPSGSPVGVTNDAPTADRVSTVAITNAAVDVALSLWSAFADAETADNQMTYQIMSNSAPSLFDTVTINSSTGNLVLNAAAGASGRAEIKVRATDGVGLTVTSKVVTYVNYQPSAPHLNFLVTSEDNNTWRFWGYVTEDGPYEDIVVRFTGAVDISTSVGPDGYFEFALILAEEDWGDVTGIAFDLEELSSTPVFRSIGNS